MSACDNGPPTSSLLVPNFIHLLVFFFLLQISTHQFSLTTVILKDAVVLLIETLPWFLNFRIICCSLSTGFPSSVTARPLACFGEATLAAARVFTSVLGQASRKARCFLICYPVHKRLNWQTLRDVFQCSWLNSSRSHLPSVSDFSIAIDTLAPNAHACNISLAFSTVHHKLLLVSVAASVEHS